MATRSTRPSRPGPAAQYDFKEATLYTAFKRLEQAGYITSYWGEEGPGRPPPVLLHYRGGRKYQAESLQQWKNTRALLDALINIEEE